MNAERRPVRGGVLEAGEASIHRIPPDGHNGENPYAGRDQAEQHADGWWWSCAMQAVEAMAATGRTFQAHDVADVYGLADPDSPNRWGALMGAAHRLGIVEPVGVAMSSRRSTARSLVRTWRGAP